MTVGRHDQPDESGDDAADRSNAPTDDVTADPSPAAGDAATAASDDPSAADTTSAGETTSAADVTPTPEPSTPLRRGRRRAERQSRPKRKAPWWELPALVIVAILIAIGVKSFIIQPFYIPSGSMEHTLHGCDGCSGDRILVNKTVYYFRDPEPGDIVVFDLPKDWTSSEPASVPPSNPILRGIRGFGQLIGFVPPDGEILVKRVIAVGGQTVKGDAQGHVFVSDHGTAGPYRELNEPYVFRDDPSDGDKGYADFPPVTIPKGRLWVLGDHRDNSADSRFHCGPNGVNDGVDQCAKYATEATVPDGDVIGKAIVIAWPPSRWTTLGTPSTFEAAGQTVAQGALPVFAVAPLLLLRRRRRRR